MIGDELVNQMAEDTLKEIDSTDKYEDELFKNWRAGTGLNEAKARFEEFKEVYNICKNRIDEACEKLSKVVQNISKIEEI